MTRALDDRSRSADAVCEDVAELLEPGVVPPGDDELGEARRGELGQRQLGFEEWPTVPEERHEWHCDFEQVGRELIGVAPHGLEEAHHPLAIWKILAPESGDVFDEALPRSP